MNIEIYGQSFELTGEEENINLVAESSQFKKWLKKMDRRFVINKILVQAVDKRYDGGLLFAKLSAEVVDNHGNQMHGNLFMRGDAVAMLIVLKSNDKKWVVLTSQPRFPAGKFESIEIPAGMMDGKGDFVSTAVREIEEEAGIKVNADQLVYLDEFSSSCGGSDEVIKLYSCEIEMSKEKIEKLHGKITGVKHENEKLRVIIVPFDDMPKHTRDPKALLAYGCYNGWI
ncbi:NUDIX domain-containing protein [bacterium]|nr:NUDIX domain-containing protein [bacterium]